MLFSKPCTATRATLPLLVKRATFPTPLDVNCAIFNTRRPPVFISVRHATHGAQGRANGPKNGPGKRLGAKKTGDEYVIPGNIIFRQRGTLWFPGENAGMGRDHTIFALESGFVKYYRNPSLNPKRRYIGIVFDKTQTLPTPSNAARRRRLGMVAVPRPVAVGAVDGAVVAGGVGGELGFAAEDAAGLSKKEMKEAKRKKAAGRVEGSALQMRSDYGYRESNYQIGRAAERAGVKVKQFERGNRFLAWRRKGARKAKIAEKRALGKQKGAQKKARKIQQ